MLIVQGTKGGRTKELFGPVPSLTKMHWSYDDLGALGQLQRVKTLLLGLPVSNSSWVRVPSWLLAILTRKLSLMSPPLWLCVSD